MSTDGKRPEENLFARLAGRRHEPSRDGGPETTVEPRVEIPIARGLESAWSVLRRGLAQSPELRKGFGYTVVLAMAGSLGSLLIPILMQQVLDRGIGGPRGFRAEFVYTICSIAAGLIVLVYLAARESYRRMVRASESALASLRVRTFAHIHRLSIAEQTANRRGAFVSRVTSDIDTLAQFMEWGAISWITGTALVSTTAIAMILYSWQLSLIVFAVMIPLFFAIRALQQGLLAAYDSVRTRVADMLSHISESVMGAAVVRAYGLEERMDRRLKQAIEQRYGATLYANRFQATLFPISDLFGGIALAAIVGAGAWFGPDWGLSAGRVVAFVFLVHLFVQPLGELSETFDQTQMAIAGWRKVLTVLDLPVDVIEPSPGIDLNQGALSVEAENVYFGYRDGGIVLRGIDATIPAGAHVAIVGRTGCGKTTFAKLLCRLADPVEGRIAVGGVDLRHVAPASRRNAIRMVPQDGFLFEATVTENVAYGRQGATQREVEAVFAELGLTEWAQGLEHGLATRVGERGSSLSVGEAQLVALARAHIAGPGLLILDEATSAVDPETELRLAEALDRVAKGRTTVTIAHRMSTAETADFVLVFDDGRIVERGDHQELLAADGVYAFLYRHWLGSTRVM